MVYRDAGRAIEWLWSAGLLILLTFGMIEVGGGVESGAAQDGQVPVTVATSAGELGVTLDADAAPCTVHNFVSLAEQGWYDDTTCHRLTTQGIYVLQCGDPTASGMGGPGYTIPDEVSGEETYPAGTVAMAKTAAPDSGGSQFFLVHDDTELPPEYTVFGQVDAAGLDVLRSIAKVGTATGAPDGPPKDDVRIESVTTG
jgi:peptidyl-prolyl cis-trans isomerase B (cyclophilin B)